MMNWSNAVGFIKSYTNSSSIREFEFKRWRTSKWVLTSRTVSAGHAFRVRFSSGPMLLPVLVAVTPRREQLSTHRLVCPGAQATRCRSYQIHGCRFQLYFNCIVKMSALQPRAQAVIL
jgi:hypothetical protein